jgi:hypothetical protein
MTVKELIDALQVLPPDFRVAANAGGRWHEINTIAFVEPPGREIGDARSSIQSSTALSNSNRETLLALIGWDDDLFPRA